MSRIRLAASTGASTIELLTTSCTQKRRIATRTPPREALAFLNDAITPRFRRDRPPQNHWAQTESQEKTEMRSQTSAMSQSQPLGHCVRITAMLRQGWDVHCDKKVRIQRHRDTPKATSPVLLAEQFGSDPVTTTVCERLGQKTFKLYVTCSSPYAMRGLAKLDA